jgi:ABC-type transport system involved in cytochrome c biogenesis permease component
MNAVLRGDFRSRVSSPKAITMHTIFLLVVAILTYLALPEVGRLDTPRLEGLLLVCVLVTTLLVMYFASSCACREIALEGEKSVWDLAATSLPAGAVAVGKVLSSAALATVQVLFASPLLAAIAGIRGESLAIVWQVAFVAVPAATAVGTAGALYSALWDSDFARSFVHWMTLLAIIVGANALPPPWNALSPVQALAIMLKEGTVLPALLAVSAYLALALGCAIAIRRRVDTIRREAVAA